MQRQATGLVLQFTRIHPDDAHKSLHGRISRVLTRIQRNAPQDRDRRCALLQPGLRQYGRKCRFPVN